MTYVINEPCIGTKSVDGIHPSPDEPDYGQHEQLYIDPAECIDCEATLL